MPHLTIEKKHKLILVSLALFASVTILTFSINNNTVSASLPENLPNSKSKEIEPAIYIIESQGIIYEVTYYGPKKFEVTSFKNIRLTGSIPEAN